MGYATEERCWTELAAAGPRPVPPGPTTHAPRRRPRLPGQPVLLLVGAAVGEHFTATEQIEKGVPTQGAVLAGGDEANWLIGRQETNRRGADWRTRGRTLPEPPIRSSVVPFVPHTPPGTDTPANGTPVQFVWLKPA